MKGGVQMLSLDYTGHPLFDVGLAAIVAHVDKDSPADLTEDDLHSVADYIDTYYTEQPLMSFLTVSLPNSDFTNPAFRDKPKRRHDYARLIQLFGEPLGKCCPLLIQLSLDMRPGGVLREGLNSAPSSCLKHLPI